jgi:hypothetical protein
MTKKSVLSLIAVSILFIAISPLYAVPVDLVIFNNSAVAALQPAQLHFTVEATDIGSGKVAFEIKNLSAIDSVIKSVYFDVDPLAGMSIADIVNGIGTNFAPGSNPAELPAGKDEDKIASFGGIFDTVFSAGATSPSGLNGNGIDRNESIIVNVNLGGNDATSVVNMFENGDIRVGAHIGSIPGYDSVSAVSTPEPATIALLGLGSLILMKKRSGK